MAETKTLYLDLVPSAQDNLTAAIERIESVGLSAAGAARHVVEPYINAVRGTVEYLGTDHNQLLDSTLGFASKLAEQQRAFLTELVDVLRGKPAARHQTKARTTNSAAA